MTLQVTDRLLAGFHGDVRMLDFGAHVDERGRLVELDFSVVPFPVRRVFTVAAVPAGTTRGGHRHRSVEQVLSCVAGVVEVEVKRGDASRTVTLTPDTGALYLAAGVWSSQRYAEDGSVLAVLASEPFDASGYDHEY